MITIENVEANFAGSSIEGEGPYFAYYNTAGANVTASDLKIIISSAIGRSLQAFVSSLPSGTTVKLQAGTYYVSAALTAPEGVTIDDDDATFIITDFLVDHSFGGTEGIAVGGIKEYKAVQDALSAASAGDTIYVAAGTYSLPENTRLIVNKSLTITGAGKNNTKIYAKAFKDTGESITSPMLETRADDITISGIHFEWDLDNIAPSGNGNAAVFAGDNVNIVNNKFTIKNAVGYPAVVMIGKTTGNQPLVKAETINFDRNEVVGSVSVVTISSGDDGVNVSITNNNITCTNMEGIWIDQTATLNDAFVISGNSISSVPEGFFAIKLVKKVKSVNGDANYTSVGISEANNNATVDLYYLPGDIYSDYPSRLYALNTPEITGYGVVASFIDFTLGDVLDISISIFDSGGNKLQTNTLISDLPDELPGHPQIMSPFVVSGTFNYVTDGNWETDGGIYGSDDVPEYAMAEIVLTNGKTIIKRINFWEP